MDAEASSQRRILVCLATYNEIGNLPQLLSEIWRWLPPADVLVIDDNSPDGTGRWCSEYAEDHDQLRCLVRPGKMGLGTATWLAMQEAVAADYDLLLTMDADFSHPPEVLPKLLAAADSTTDVVLGSRYIDGGGVTGWPLRRRLMSRGVNWAGACLAAPCRRVTTVARSAVTVSPGCINCWPVRYGSHGYAFCEEVLWRLKRTGARFREVPFVFRDRLVGSSKLNLAEAVRSLGVLLWLGTVERGWCRDLSAEGR